MKAIILLLMLLSFRGYAAETPKAGDGTEDKGKPKVVRSLLFNQLIEMLNKQKEAQLLSPHQLVKAQAIIKQLESQKNSASRSEQERELIEKLEGALVTIAKKKPTRENFEALARFFIFADEPEKAMKFLKQSGASSKADIYHPLLSSYTALRLGDYAQGIKFIRKVEAIISKRAPLMLSKPIPCKTVKAYRVYTLYPQNEIRPGSEISLYTEIEGATFREKGSGQTECNLKFGMILRNTMQEDIVDNDDYGVWRKAYQGRVRDLHVRIRLSLPKDLSNGRHTVIINCTDRFSGKKASSNFTFSVGKAAAIIKKDEVKTPVTAIEDLDNLEDINDYINKLKEKAAGITDKTKLDSIEARKKLADEKLLKFQTENSKLLIK